MIEEELKSVSDSVLKNIHALLRNDKISSAAEYAEKNNIDVITSKSDIIYNSDKYDITKDIIEVFKERDLFSDIKDMKNKLTDDIEL
jgi:Skp family chaperone for outer membrane proteins